MKQFFFIASLLFVSAFSIAQKKAVTETGEEVILYDNGTWKYANDSTKQNDSISTNKNIFKKNPEAAFLLKSTRTNIGVWLNSKKWSFKKSSSNEAAEYEFQLKSKDLYAEIITEKIGIPLESLKNAAFQNAKEAAPDMKIISQEFRTVNGKKMLMMQMTGTVMGIKFTYFGYYFSSPKGTVQFLTYTSENLFTELMADAEELLNGLVEIE